ncbi:hypothetical protein J4449_00120 [Candidatus Woesearchaeota archaeon]|nr:hypothetical protein [Candidatus Woesearchaeota archaeon]
MVKFVSQNQNLSCIEIAKQFNVHESVVRRACKKFGVKKLDAHKYRLSQKIHLTSLQIESNYKV